MSTKIPLPGSWIKPVAAGPSVLEQAKDKSFTENIEEAINAFAEMIEFFTYKAPQINGSTLIVDDRGHNQFTPKPYELRPHLTDKPFKNNPELANLRDRLIKETHK